MSKGTLDSFFGTKPPPKKLHCSNPACNKELGEKETTFKLRIKGEEKVYCMACYKAKMKPLENSEENL
jgi:hypothetical protein